MGGIGHKAAQVQSMCFCIFVFSCFHMFVFLCLVFCVFVFFCLRTVYLCIYEVPEHIFAPIMRCVLV